MKVKRRAKSKRQQISRIIKLAKKQGKSVIPKQLAACYGKIRYTKSGAKDRADTVGTMSAYKCKFCNYWHVGRRQKNMRSL